MDKQKQWLRALTLAIVLAVVPVTREAHAVIGWPAVYTCGSNNRPIIWNRSITITRNQCTIPNGSMADNAFWNAITQWRRIGSLLIGNVAATPSWDCEWNHGDGVNEVFLVNPDTIDGNAGITILAYNKLDCSTGAAFFAESDVLVSNRLTFQNPDETVRDPGLGRMTLLHEFGHLHGIGHTNGLGIMRAQGGPVVGGPDEHVRLLSDDMAGLIALYGASYRTLSYTNLSASSMVPQGSWDQATAVPGDSTSQQPIVCRGQQIRAKFTYANVGIYPLGPFLASVSISPLAPPKPHQFTEPTSDGSGTGYYTGYPVTSQSFTACPMCWLTYNYDFRVPNVPNGTYWIYFRIDASAAVSEAFEDDNVTHSIQVLKVEC